MQTLLPSIPIYKNAVVIQPIPFFISCSFLKNTPRHTESDVFYASGSGSSSLFWNKQMKSSTVTMKENSVTYRNSNLNEKGITVFHILLQYYFSERFYFICCRGGHLQWVVQTMLPNNNNNNKDVFCGLPLKLKVVSQSEAAVWAQIHAVHPHTNTDGEKMFFFWHGGIALSSPWYTLLPSTHFTKLLRMWLLVCNCKHA